MRDLSIDTWRIGRPLWIAPVVNALPLDTSGDVKRKRTPCMDGGKHVDQPFNYNSPVRQAEELGSSAAHGLGSGVIDVGHLDPFVLDARIVQGIDDHLETFARLDRFAGSVHFDNLRGPIYAPKYTDASSSGTFTG